MIAGPGQYFQPPSSSPASGWRKSAKQPSAQPPPERRHIEIRYLMFDADPCGAAMRGS
jgi:hypothetical protein